MFLDVWDRFGGLEEDHPQCLKGEGVASLNEARDVSDVRYVDGITSSEMARNLEKILPGQQKLFALRDAAVQYLLFGSQSAQLRHLVFHRNRHLQQPCDTCLLHVLSRPVACCRHIAIDEGEVSHDIRGGELSPPFHVVNTDHMSANEGSRSKKEGKKERKKRKEMLNLSMCNARGVCNDVRWRPFPTNLHPPDHTLHNYLSCELKSLVTGQAAGNEGRPLPSDPPGLPRS